MVIDPVTNLVDSGNERDVSAMLIRLMDFLKLRQITSLMTSLTHGSVSAMEKKRSADFFPGGFGGCCCARSKLAANAARECTY